MNTSSFFISVVSLPGLERLLGKDALVKLFLLSFFSEELLSYFARLKIDALSAGVDLDFVSFGTTD